VTAFFRPATKWQSSLPLYVLAHLNRLHDRASELGPVLIGWFLSGRIGARLRRRLGTMR